MDCREAGDRLVAYQDGELAPSEHQKVREHIASCGACRELERRLREATPRPGLTAPAHVLARLEDRLDVDVILAMADRRGPTTRVGWLARTRTWLDRDAEVPRALVLAACTLLVASVGWGLSSWLSLHALQLEVAAQRDSPAVPAHTTATAEIPADQFVPASYTPEVEEVFH